MRNLIRFMGIIGSIIFMAAVVTAETHWVASLVWSLIGFVMIAPYLQMNYIRERQ